MYSMTPSYGAKIATCILTDDVLRKNWLKQNKQHVERIQEMRAKLIHQLGKGWEYIGNQVGMFAFTELTADQVNMLEKYYHIYALSNGRISLAGLNDSNILYVVQSIKDVIGKCIS